MTEINIKKMAQNIAQKAIQELRNNGVFFGRWIPVSEGLPERSVWVLAYCKTKDGYEYQTTLLLCKYTGEWTDNDDFCDEVIAWRPLPEPYKKESEAADL